LVVGDVTRSRVMTIVLFHSMQLPGSALHRVNVSEILGDSPAISFHPMHHLGRAGGTEHSNVRFGPRGKTNEHASAPRDGRGS